VIIALMQKNRRAQRKIGAECLTIGFAVYQVENTKRKIEKKQIFLKTLFVQRLNYTIRRI